MMAKKSWKVKMMASTLSTAGSEATKLDVIAFVPGDMYI